MAHTPHTDYLLALLDRLGLTPEGDLGQDQHRVLASIGLMAETIAQLQRQCDALDQNSRADEDTIATLEAELDGERARSRRHERDCDTLRYQLRQRDERIWQLEDQLARAERQARGAAQHPYTPRFR